MKAGWTERQIRSLGTRTDLVTAAEIIYGIGRTTAYQMYRRGELDFPTLRAGNRVVVPVSSLLRLLELDSPPEMTKRATE
jgi:hypothetical protein